MNIGAAQPYALTRQCLNDCVTLAGEGGEPLAKAWLVIMAGIRDHDELYDIARGAFDHGAAVLKATDYAVGVGPDVMRRNEVVEHIWNKFKSLISENGMDHVFMVSKPKGGK